MAMEGGGTTVGLPQDSLAVNWRDNIKVRARAAARVVASLRSKVKELEQQQDFLVSWKADPFTGADVERSFVDVEFQGLDGDRMHAHKAILRPTLRNRMMEMYICLMKKLLNMKLTKMRALMTKT